MKWARSYVFAFGFVALGATWVTGCGGSSDSAGGSVALEDVPTEFAQTACGVFEDCLGPAAAVFLADCETQQARAFEDSGFQALQARVDDGSISYDPQQARKCLDQLASSACAELDLNGATCDAVFKGKADLGDDCGLDEDCPAGAFCQVDAGTCPGECVKRLAAGGDCLDDSQCQEGLNCSADTGRCVEPAGKGDDCGGGVAPPCELGLFCLGEDAASSTAGTCKTPDDVFSGKKGDDCDVQEGPLCAVGLSCAIDLAQAVVSGSFVGECVEPSEAGDTCSLAVPEACTEGYYCDQDVAALEMEGSCVKLPKADDPCGPRGQCAPGNVCLLDGTDLTCFAMQRLGSSCMDSAQCYSGNCMDGGCAPLDVCDL